MRTYAVRSEPRDSLGWIAVGLLGAPWVLAAVWGLYRLAAAALNAQRGADSRVMSPVGAFPLGAVIDIVFMAGWVLMLNLLLPGLIIGGIRARRLRDRFWPRLVALLASQVATVALMFWTVSHARLGVAGVAFVALGAVGVLTAYAVLQPKRQVRP